MFAMSTPMMLVLAFPTTGMDLVGSRVPPPPAWQAGYQMGTLWAGAINAQGARITFYCGDGAPETPLIQRGLYQRGLYFHVVPPAGVYPDAQPKDRVRVTFDVDGQTIVVPMTFAAPASALEWNDASDVERADVDRLLATLRRGQSLSVSQAGMAETFSLAGADAALDEMEACERMPLSRG
jgi:hypothetical protein